MARKSAKSQAIRNATMLSRVHLISVALHAAFLLEYYFLEGSLSLTPYLVLSVPTLAIEIYLDRLGRPRYFADGSLRSAGHDLGASGLTEYMWDVLYWTLICMAIVCVFGNGGWWLWIVVPLYSLYMLYATFMGVKRGFAGTGGGGGGGGGGGADEMVKSKTQIKKEKRGAPKPR